MNIPTSVLVLAGIMSVGCKSRSYNSSDAKSFFISASSCLAQNADKSFPLIASPNRTTVTYHWTSRSAAETTPGAIDMVKSYLTKIASEPIEKDSNAFGPGLYVASDPSTSMSYGDILLVVPLRPNCQFGFSKAVGADSTIDESMVKSKLPGIVYSFGGEDNRALVIRTISAIDVDKIESISTRKTQKVSLSEIPLMPITGKVRLTDAIRHYGKHFPAFLLTSSNDSAMSALMQKMRTTNGGVSDFGVMMIKSLELSGSLDRMTIPLQEALKTTTGKDLFPWCFKTVADETSHASSTNSSLIFGRCLQTAWSNALKLIFPDSGAQNPEDKMSATETNRTLVLAGFLPKNWTASTSLEHSGNEVLRRVLADTVFVNSAKHIYKVMDAIDTNDFSAHNTLNAWSAPTR